MVYLACIQSAGRGRNRGAYSPLEGASGGGGTQASGSDSEDSTCNTRHQQSRKDVSLLFN